LPSHNFSLSPFSPFPLFTLPPASYASRLTLYAPLRCTTRPLLRHTLHTLRCGALQGYPSTGTLIRVAWLPAAEARSDHPASAPIGLSVPSHISGCPRPVTTSSAARISQPDSTWSFPCYLLAAAYCSSLVTYSSPRPASDRRHDFSFPRHPRSPFQSWTTTPPKSPFTDEPPTHIFSSFTSYKSPGFRYVPAYIQTRTRIRIHIGTPRPVRVPQSTHRRVLIKGNF
jgi:hypothetical protein